VLKYLYEERKITASGHETTDTDPGVATSKEDASLEPTSLARPLPISANSTRCTRLGGLSWRRSQSEGRFGIPGEGVCDFAVTCGVLATNDLTAEWTK